MDVPEPEKRTPAVFHRGLLELLQQIDPTYESNRAVKGRFREFIRPDDSGLFVSVNTLTRPSHRPKQKQYDICIAVVVAALGPPTYLHSPLWAGYRFDHNMNLAMAYIREASTVPIPSDLRRAHGNFDFRSNTFAILENDLLFAESVLLPFYFARLQSNRARVASVYRAANDIISNIGDVDDFADSDVDDSIIVTMSERPYLRDRPFSDWDDEMRREAFLLSQFPWNTDRLQLASLPRRRFSAHNVNDAYNVVANVHRKHQPHAIALDCISDFLPIRENLLALADRVEALSGG